MRIPLILLGLTTVAHADPEKNHTLGEGFSLAADNNNVYVKKGAQTAPLTKGSGFESVKVDSKARTVVVEVADNTCAGSTTYTWSFDHLDARLENTAAFVAVKKKDLKAAAIGFERAVKRDPKWNIAAYNLASVRQLVGDKAGAVAALAPWLASEPIATYTQATIDPDLAPLLDRAELRALRGKQPGNAKVTVDGIVGSVAYAPDKTLLAVTRLEPSGTASSYKIDLEIYDAVTGARRATFALVGWTDTRNDSDKPTLTGTGKAAAGKRAAMFQKLIDDLGFSPTPVEVAGNKIDDDDKIKLSLPKAKLGVVGKDDTARALRGNLSVGTAKIEGKLMSATLVDAAHTIVLTSHRTSAEGCDGGPEVGVYLMRLQP